MTLQRPASQTCPIAQSPCPPQPIICVQNPRWFACVTSCSGSQTSEGGETFAASWLARPRAQAPTAIVCGNDTLALDFLRAILQNGVRVPDEVSVTGFDGAPEAGLCWPGLTTVRQPSQAMGDAACKALLRLVENPGVVATTRLELPAALITRESTGPAPTGARRGH
jgi:LacI family transcriptional regulator, repressor for deo operon, udp, cdd, tsx, nupC, and nupG